MGDRTLYLIRHGQYDLSTGSLTDLGRAQAEVLSARLRQVPLDAIHASTFPRAIESAIPIRREHPAAGGRNARYLIECIPYVPRRRPEIASDEEQRLRNAARVERALTTFGKPTRGRDQHVAIVFHGNFIRALTLRLMAIDPSAWIDLQIHHASLTVVRVGKDSTRLVSYNDTGHLPPAMVTES